MANALRQIREKVAAAGYSLSIGYAMKTQDQTQDDALRISDQNMYKEKAEYYQSSGRDRRMRQGDKS